MISHSEKIAVVSTAHVTRETADKLALAYPYGASSNGAAYREELPLGYAHGEYGWLLLTSDTEGVPERCPPELAALLRQAQESGCEWLLLDRDAAIDPDLPSWEW